MLRSRLLRIATLPIAMIPLCSTALAQNTAPKRRIAVMNFDYRAANPDTLAALFGGEQDIGKGIAALLIAELVREGGYTVIEYAALDKVLAEQDLSNAERVDPWIASRAGRILGVDAILVGSITRFGPEQEPKNSSGKPGRFASLSGSSGAATKKSKAVVDLTVRVVDPMTGDLLASVIGTGISPEAGTFYYVNLRTKQGDFNFSSSQFAGTVLGQATRNAVDQTAAQLLALVDKIPFAKRAISGRIADVSGNELTLNVGSRDGLKMGDTLTVRHQIRVIVIPLPGAGIRDIAEVVGTATVTALDAGSAIATFSGNGPPAIGDAVETHP